jgi:protein-S-isoprenylcysteine O-methyltransferase Ste14
MTHQAPFSRSERIIALLYGAASHCLFTLSVLTMIMSLLTGIQFGYGTLTGGLRIVSNTALILQFPVFHSLLLSNTGRGLLKFLAPTQIARHLQPTTYVMISSLQILLVFLLWSPHYQILWQPTGIFYLLHLTAFIASWLLLAKSMWDAHLGIQTGYIGWLSVWQNRAQILWPGLATHGLFRLCRQPIYFSFMLTLWTSPVWTFDKIYLASLWTIYCFVGPLLKERRFERLFGELFARYKERVPYWPLIR